MKPDGLSTMVHVRFLAASGESCEQRGTALVGRMVRTNLRVRLRAAAPERGGMQIPPDANGHFSAEGLRARACSLEVVSDRCAEAVRIRWVHVKSRILSWRA